MNPSESEVKKRSQSRCTRSRELKRKKIEKDLQDISVLFIVHPSITKIQIEVDDHWRNMPFHQKRILNLDIFELNDVRTIQDIPYGRRMSIDHNSTELAVLSAMSQVSIRDQLNQDNTNDANSPGCKFITPLLSD